MAYFRMGKRCVGEAAPVYIVAEIGANHNGDPALARDMVSAAAATGADAVKFQMYRTSSLLADRDRKIVWGPPGKERREPIGAMFDRLSLPLSAYAPLFRHARSLGITPFATPFSPYEARRLLRLGVPGFKIASSDVAYGDLLRTAGGSGKPVLLSTGKSTLGEIEEAVAMLRAAHCQDVALLHCSALYPAPAPEINLRAMVTLGRQFPDCVIGYSDHSIGIAACLGATALGARIIEKHFTLDKRMDGPDHWFSADPAETAQLVREVRFLEQALGSTRKGVSDEEKKERKVSTRSLVLKTALEAGTVLRRTHLKAVRPGWGIHPGDVDKVAGLALRKSLPANSVLTWEHLRG